MHSSNAKKKCSSDGGLFLIDNVIYCHDGLFSTKLSKNEVELFNLLLKNSGGKDEIIRTIFGGKDELNVESKYSQLICRLRRKLAKAGFPSDIIVTKQRSDPSSGIYINKLSISSFDKRPPGLDVESRVINFFHM